MDRYGLDGTGDGLLQKPFDGRRLVAAAEQAPQVISPRRMPSATAAARSLTSSFS